MSEIGEAQLAEIGRKAALKVPGLGTVDDVKVTDGLDSSDRPAYFFTFLIDRDRDRQQIGLTRIRLYQKLREELAALNDDSLPIVRVLNKEDWEKSAR